MRIGESVSKYYGVIIYRNRKILVFNHVNCHLCHFVRIDSYIYEIVLDVPEYLIEKYDESIKLGVGSASVEGKTASTNLYHFFINWFRN